MSNCYSCRTCRHWGAAKTFEFDPTNHDEKRPCALTERPGYDGNPVYPNGLAIAAGSEGPACLFTSGGFSCSEFSERK